MGYVGVVLIVVVTAALAEGQTSAPQQGNFPVAVPDAKDMITIDGAKEPWRIPQYAAWRNAFRFIANAAEVPSEIYPLLSAGERSAVLREAAASRRNDDAYDAYRLEFRGRLLARYTACKGDNTCEREASKQASVFRRVELKYRRRTLDSRDRVMAVLGATNPAARAKLAQWVETMKRGLQATMRKSDEAHYKKPE